MVINSVFSFPFSLPRIIIVSVDVAIINYDKSVHSIELLWIYKLVYLGIVCGK